VSPLGNRIIKTLAVLAVLGAGVIASWAALDTAFHMTGDYEFCTGCHGYEPIAQAYREDIHGGNNPSGVRAACNDCHIPHDNSLHYFWVKARHGIMDPTMALLKAPHDIDWHGIRERREEFVCDSSCLNCHKYLQEVTEGNRKAFRAHRLSPGAGGCATRCPACERRGYPGFCLGPGVAGRMRPLPCGRKETV